MRRGLRGRGEREEVGRGEKGMGGMCTGFRGGSYVIPGVRSITRREEAGG